MQLNINTTKLFIIITTTLLLAGCNFNLPKINKSYKEAATISPLIMPEQLANKKESQRYKIPTVSKLQKDEQFKDLALPPDLQINNGG